MRLGRGTTRAERVRSTSAVVAGVTVPAVLAIMAVIDPGVKIAEVDLNDGAVWVTNRSELKLGRYDATVRELNGGLVATDPSFDVLQSGQDVLLVEPGRVSTVDPATMALTTQAEVPAGSQVAMGAGVVAVTSPEGSVWVRTMTSLASVTSDTPGDIDLGDGGMAVVDPDGLILALDPTDGTVHRGEMVDGALAVTDAGTLEGAAGVEPEAVTAVDGTLVMLADGTLHGDGWTTDLVDGAAPVLQQPSTSGTSVAVGTTTHLLEVDLRSGDVAVTPTSGQGTPAAPVRLGDCLYGAWASPTGSYLVRCGDDEPTLIDLERMTAQSTPVFRVNRSVVALNDTLQGLLWLPDDMPRVQVPNWDQIEQDDDTTDTEDESDEVETTQQQLTECTPESAAPGAVDDDLAVRPGRSTILEVLNNDTAGDCGIIAIDEIDTTTLDAGFATVETIYGGRALQAVVSPQAQGSATITYTISDGRGNSPPSTATVTLRASDPDSNSAPLELRTGSVEVEQGATVDVDALANFVDPDGDELVLLDAVTDGTATVRARQNGMLTVTAEGETLGRQTVTLVVSDGIEQTTGQVAVDVRATGSLPPKIDPIHVVTEAGKDVDVDVLESVHSLSREPARLASVDEPAGTTVSPNLDDGSFTFTATNAATYYVPFTVVASPQQAQGLVRVDVVEPSTAPQRPVAVRDLAPLPRGGEVLVDPLANDVDPAGGVLVVTAVSAAEGSALQAVVVDHRYVRISSQRDLDAPETLEYRVSNGFEEVAGEILVQPVQPSGLDHPPVLQDLEATVRTTGVVTVPVLDSAVDPDGDEMSIVPDLLETLPAEKGLLFASGDVLRFQASGETGTVETTYSVQDAGGNVTTARLSISVHASDPETKAAPRPRALTARTFDGETVRIPVPLTGIDPDGDGVTLLGQGDSVPSLGRVVAVGADYLEYEAYPGSYGTDTFQYAVEDWTGQRAQATVRVGISPRSVQGQPIVARNDEATVRPGQRVEVRVLRNDVDPSGGELTLAPELEVPPGVDAHVDKRRVVVTAPAEPVDALTIVYTVTNTLGSTARATLTLHVVDDAPIAAPIARDVTVAPIEVVDKTSVEVDVLALAENPSGPLSDLEVSIPSSHSGVAQVIGDGQVLVTLTDRTQTIPYRLTNTRPEADGVGAYAFIVVPALGDFPPTLRPKARELRVASGEELVISLAEFVQVGTGKTARVRDAERVSATNSDEGELVVDDTTLRYVSAPGYAGPASITVEVTDGATRDDPAARRSVLTLPITVFTEDERPPTFTPSELLVPQGESTSVDLLGFTRGPQGASAEQKYTYEVVQAPGNGFLASITPGTTRLAVSVPADVARGTLGTATVRLGYGTVGTMDVQVTFKVAASSRQLATLQVHEADGAAGRDVTVNALAGAGNPFSEPLTLLSASPAVAGQGTARVSGGNVVVRPAEGFTGLMVVRYRVRDVTGDPLREVDGTIRVAVRDIPAAPSAPRVGEVSSRAVPLSWDAPATNGSPITGYRVTRSPGGQTTQCATTACTITGLTNGTEYTFTVAAQNALGWSAESPASGRATPDAVPGVPGSPNLEPGDRQVTATWAAPANDGTPVTKYTAELSGPQGIVSREVAGTTIVFSGLPNGAGYTVRVRAHNSATPPEGGAWSGASRQAIPAGLPGTPEVGASRVDTLLGGQIRATWTTPDANGSAITGYTVVAQSSGHPTLTYQAGGGETETVFSSVVNGADYTISVTAKNTVGAGSAGVSAPTSTFAPPGAPGRGPTTAASGRPFGDGQVTASWSPPAETGGVGVGISYYEVEGRPEQIGGTSLTIGGLPGGEKSPGLRVRAVNNRGAAGPWTDLATTDIFTVAATPAVSVTATAGWYSTVTASWPEPANGGSAITGYKVRYNGEDWASLPAGQRSVEYRDIVPDTGARVEVIAVTSQGDSAVGAGTGVPTVPRPPGAPAGLNAVPTADPPSVQINWQEPTINGSPVTGYSYRVYRSNGPVPGWQDTAPDVRSVTVTSGISEGDWVVEVSARSDRGRGEVASTSVHVDAAATPDPTDPGGG